MDTTLSLLPLCLLVAMVTAHSGHHGEPPKSFDPNIIMDLEHLKEHMQNQINTDRPMTPTEMGFYYFRLHDINNDTHLDGLEMLKALSHIIHTTDFEPDVISGKTAEEVEDMRNKRFREMMANFVHIIDNVLQMDDTNDDGYLSYTEYRRTMRRDPEGLREMQEKMEQQPFNTLL
ncbi:multiple coagulation factor deficiency protein 2 homolog [Physella acuta]|uniref:multiple coagulation factor deficiency protein 2 homolog n=1 Tax=Physella acuta TaxID=109671 RepID=UPI0027DBF114|nr:multiple coagulation factor deficiency protein 2 homolog [Physella acuta]XP_059148037.1 multiple coagulation factor deficiency protein 2 homolog [Physella acuta]